MRANRFFDGNKFFYGAFAAFILFCLFFFFFFFGAARDQAYRSSHYQHPAALDVYDAPYLSSYGKEAQSYEYHPAYVGGDYAAAYPTGYHAARHADNYGVAYNEDGVQAYDYSPAYTSTYSGYEREADTYIHPERVIA